MAEEKKCKSCGADLTRECSLEVDWADGAFGSGHVDEHGSFQSDIIDDYDSKITSISCRECGEVLN